MKNCNFKVEMLFTNRFVRKLSSRHKCNLEQFPLTLYVNRENLRKSVSVRRGIIKVDFSLSDLLRVFFRRIATRGLTLDENLKKNIVSNALSKKYFLLD